MLRDSFGVLRWQPPIEPSIYEVTQPLKDPSILLDPSIGCHIDHEGFDLNEIEQAYYREQGVALSHDPTLYKDGAGEAGATAIIQPWCIQSFTDNEYLNALIVDHSHFVYRYPIGGAARDQIVQYIPQRPELARLLSARFKCGLDFCLDIFFPDRVEPIVHIEWDFDTYDEMAQMSKIVEELVFSVDWDIHIPTVVRYNELARINKVDAFDQADTRSQLLFGKKSYILIPTL